MHLLRWLSHTIAPGPEKQRKQETEETVKHAKEVMEKVERVTRFQNMRAVAEKQNRKMGI